MVDLELAFDVTAELAQLVIGGPAGAGEREDPVEGLLRTRQRELLDRPGNFRGDQEDQRHRGHEEKADEDDADLPADRHAAADPSRLSGRGDLLEQPFPGGVAPADRRDGRPERGHEEVREPEGRTVKKECASDRDERDSRAPSREASVDRATEAQRDRLGARVASLDARERRAQGREEDQLTDRADGHEEPHDREPFRGRSGMEDLGEENEADGKGDEGRRYDQPEKVSSREIQSTLRPSAHGSRLSNGSKRRLFLLRCDGVPATEAGSTVLVSIISGPSDRVKHSLFGEIAERVGADELADLFDRVRRPRSAPAASACRSRSSRGPWSAARRCACALRPRPAALSIRTILRRGGPADDRVVDEDEPLAGDDLPDGLSFTLTPKWRIDCFGSMNVRPT